MSAKLGTINMSVCAVGKRFDFATNRVEIVKILLLLALYLYVGV